MTMTTGSFYKMYEEQYSSKGGPSTIRIEDGQAKWTLDLGGVVHTGAVSVEDAGGQEQALALARRAVEATAANPPQQADPAAAEEQPEPVTDKVPTEQPRIPDPVVPDPLVPAQDEDKKDETE